MLVYILWYYWQRGSQGLPRAGEPMMMMIIIRQNLIWEGRLLKTLMPK